MKSVFACAALFVGALVLTSPSAWAGGNGCGQGCVHGGGDGGFHGHRTEGTPGIPPAPGAPAPGAPEAPGVPGPAIETQYVPTCPGNHPDGNAEVCGAALSGCDRPDEVRHWVYERQTSPVLTPWRRRTPPPFVCLGPGDQGIDPLVAVIATVRSQFAFYPLERAVVVTRPTGQTLVNAPTMVTTGADGRDSLTRTILGMQVHVQATATEWRWHFGDGTSTTATAGGSQTHVYRTPGTYTVSLDLVYTGTFTVGSSPTTYAVDGTATVRGPAAGVTVREAHSELVGG